MYVACLRRPAWLRAAAAEWFGSCADASADSSAVTRHERRHTGEQPAVCDYPGCHFACGDYSNLARHVRTHTGVSLDSLMIDDRIERCCSLDHREQLRRCTIRVPLKKSGPHLAGAPVRVHLVRLPERPEEHAHCPHPEVSQRRAAAFQMRALPLCALPDPEPSEPHGSMSMCMRAALIWLT